MQVLVGKSEGTRPLRRPRRKWEDNIKMDLQEIEWGHGLHWSDLGQGQVADTCECGNEPSVSVKCGEFVDQLGKGQLLKKNLAAWRK